MLGYDDGMTQMIYHMCRAEEWAAAKSAGMYHGSSQDLADGFIHFSTGEQIAESARKHRTGQAGLVLVTVDAAVMGERLHWEPSRGGELFPHLYGPLYPAESAKVEPLPIGPDGTHVFPNLG
jgi:uncharacterized protein (DUF952 family)